MGSSILNFSLLQFSFLQALEEVRWRVLITHGNAEYLLSADKNLR